MPEKTTIEVSVATWTELNQRKSPGQSFDDVLREELGLNDDRAEEQEEKDVVAWVREHQPVERSEIINAFEDEIEQRGIKAESWWTRHAKPQLEESGAEFTRNVGWRFE